MHYQKIVIPLYQTHCSQFIRELRAGTHYHLYNALYGTRNGFLIVGANIVAYQTTTALLAYRADYWFLITFQTSQTIETTKLRFAPYPPHVESVSFERQCGGTFSPDHSRLLEPKGKQSLLLAVPLLASAESHNLQSPEVTRWMSTDTAVTGSVCSVSTCQNVGRGNRRWKCFN